MYIQAKSKKAVNDALAAGQLVTATDYSPFSCKTLSWDEIPNGTPIKIFEKYVGGNPYAKAYGVKKGNKLA